MNTWLKVSHHPQSGSVLGSLLLAGMLLAGCGGEDASIGVTNPPGSDPARVFVNTPAQIAQESADDYDQNVNGLITGTTLKRWKDDWLNERPAGITGKLVILQVSAGPAEAEYIKPNGTNVFTYLSPSSEWTQVRNNGVIETVQVVPDGPSMDALIKKYNIDPHNDMIVAATGTGSTGNAMAQGRVWYALRYWGVEATNLALVNGGNQWLNGSSMTAADFQATGSTPPNNGTVSVMSLPADNTQLQATVQDMLAILPSGNINVLNDGVFIWDARGMNQYSAGEKLELGQAGCAEAFCDPPEGFNYMSTFQNGGSRQGHPWGTLKLQFTRMLDSSKGFSYKPKAELARYLTGELDDNGIGFVDSTYQPVGVGNAYQEGDTIYAYCETTFRAMITGVASAVILGKPTRFYDGAMVEWHSLTHGLDSEGNYILPMNSPWRTDVVSFYRPAADPSTVTPRTVTDPYAADTNTIVRDDRAYKIGSSSGGGAGGGAGGGGALPTNPCGG